jgi:hypothetical protein
LTTRSPRSLDFDFDFNLRSLLSLPFPSLNALTPSPSSLPPKNSFLANQLVSLQLSRQIIEENLLQKSIVIMQSSSATFEAGIVRSIKSAWETFDEWYARMSGASRALYEAVGREMRGVVPEREWVEYVSVAVALFLRLRVGGC